MGGCGVKPIGDPDCTTSDIINTGHFWPELVQDLLHML